MQHMVTLLRAIVLILALGTLAKVAEAQQWDGNGSIGPFYEPSSNTYWRAYLYDGPLSNIADTLIALGYAEHMVSGNPDFRAGTDLFQQKLAQWAEQNGSGWLPGCKDDWCVLMAPVSVTAVEGLLDWVVVYVPTKWHIYEQQIWGWSGTTVGQNRVWVIWVQDNE